MPLRRWLLVLVVTLLLSALMSVQVVADYYTGIYGEKSISSSATTGSWLRIDTSSTTSSELSISISLITAPAITADNATAITNASARLNSTVDDDGADSPVEVRFGIGTVSHIAADFSSYTYISAWVDGYSTGSTPFFDMTGLGPSTTYYYRAQIRNTYGTVTSVNEINFTTLTGIANVSNLVAIPNGSNISLKWTSATGSTSTVIRYRTDTYPLTPADGTSVYNSSGFQYTMTGVTAGRTYFFAAWGYDGFSYSTNSATAVANGAADAGYTTNVTLPVPTLPANLTDAPDVSNFNFEPFTTIFNNFNDAPGGLGIPEGNFFEFISMIVLVMIGAFVGASKKSLAAGWVVVFVGSLLGVGLGIFQGGQVIVVLVIGLGAWAVDRYLQ